MDLAGDGERKTAAAFPQLPSLCWRRAVVVADLAGCASAAGYCPPPKACVRSITPPLQIESPIRFEYGGECPLNRRKTMTKPLYGLGWRRGKEKQQPRFRSCRLCVGAVLFSRAVASQVSSPLMSLTSVFGMGTGGPSSLLVPTSSKATSRASFPRFL